MASDVKCPICGSETILRTVKKGPEAGKQFHVCSRYPECKGRVEYTEGFRQEEDEYEEPTNKGKPIGKTGEKVLIVLAIIVVIAVIIVCLIKFDVVNIGLGKETSSTSMPTAHHSPTLSNIELLSYEWLHLNQSSCPSRLSAGTRQPVAIKGTIYNKASYEISYVEVQVKWCEWDTNNSTCGEYVHTSYGYVYDLEAGQVKEFTAPEDGYCGAESGYTIQISDVK